ncbi:vesicle-associated membrane protein-associated protein Scs2p [Monosporozyma servazzii]
MSSIEILPDVLEYNPPLTEQSTEYATISNNSSDTIAFKVKTTAPKYYCVRPNAAVVAPGETVQIQVIFLGLPEEPKLDSKCKDKFLVITLPAPHDLGDKSVAEAWSDLESEFSAQAVSKKIKVRYAQKMRPEVVDVEDENTIPVATKKEAVEEEEEEEKETSSSNDVTPTSASAEPSTDKNNEDVTSEKKSEEEIKEDSKAAPESPALYPPIIVALVAILVALIVRQYYF